VIPALLAAALFALASVVGYEQGHHSHPIGMAKFVLEDQA